MSSQRWAKSYPHTVDDGQRPVQEGARNMPKVTDQIQHWAGSFGQEYTERNALSLKEMEAMYKSRYSLTRTELNERFLTGVDRSARILEVGSNVGNQLLCLQHM